MKSIYKIKNNFLFLLLLSLFGVATAQTIKEPDSRNRPPLSVQRTPTGMFEVGKDLAGKQVLTNNLVNYLPKDVYNATLERSLISPGNTARLRRVMQKAANGDPIVVGFIGGSITEGAGSSLRNKRYADQIYNWWKMHFPKSDITYVNAGIGGTPSSYGVFRSKPHLNSKKPDFVLIEFAVNDLELDAETVPYMEGLIRKAFDQDNDPAVMLLFMMTSSVESDDSVPRPWLAMNGKPFVYKKRAYGLNVQNYQIPLGQHYDLPMISFRDVVFPFIKEGYFKWHEIIFDNVHPNDFGHTFAAKLVTHFLDSVHEENIHGDPIRAIPPVPRPFKTDKYEKTVYVDFKPHSTTDPRIKVSSIKGFERSPRGYWLSAVEQKPAKMEITFTGRDFYLGAISNKDYGSLTVSLKDSSNNTLDQKVLSYKNQYIWKLGGVKPVFTDLQYGTYRAVIQTTEQVEIIGAAVDANSDDAHAGTKPSH